MSKVFLSLAIGSSRFVCAPEKEEEKVEKSGDLSEIGRLTNCPNREKEEQRLGQQIDLQLT